jgi:membrane protease YdiL (CAAX protease family)
MRLALLMKAAGEDPNKAWARYDSVSAIREKTGTSTRKDTAAAVSEDRVAEIVVPFRKLYNDRLSRDEIIAFGERVARNEVFPSGWYREQLLEEIYKRTDPAALQVMQADHVERCHRLVSVVETILSIEMVMSVIGVGALIFFGKSLNQMKPEGPSNFGFRAAYGAFLSFFCFFGAGGFFVGFVLGILVAVKIIPAGTDVLGIPPTVWLQMIGHLLAVSGTALSIYLFVCRPAGMSFWQLFKSEDTTTSAKRSLAYVFFGFAGMCLMARIAGMVLHFLVSRTPTLNPLQYTYVDIFNHGKYLAVAWMTVAVCVLSPFAEEIIFRRLLYTWMRQRFGITIGLLASSAVFAAMHLDPNNFFTHMVLGVVLAFVYEKTRNIWYSIALHITWNTWATLASTLSLATY